MHAAARCTCMRTPQLVRACSTQLHCAPRVKCSKSLALLSHVRGAAREPLVEDTLGELLHRQARRFPGHRALTVVHQDVEYSYKDFLHRVDAFCKGLCALGLKKGDRLGVWMPNNSEWIIAQFATARLGIILVNVNPAYRAHELEFSLNMVGCKALIITEQVKTSNYARLLYDILPELTTGAPILKSKAIPSLQHVVITGPHRFQGMHRFDDLCLSDANSEVFQTELTLIGRKLSPHDPVNIQFTSGTTGLPKGATLSHFNIINNGKTVGDTLGLTEWDVMCIPVPLYHCFGAVLGNLAGLTHGSQLVYPAPVFDPEATLQAVHDHRCSVLHGVPTMFIAMLNHPAFSRVDLSCLRTGIMAGSTCPAAVMSDVIHKMGVRDVSICYGMTETSPVSFQTRVGTPLEKRVSTVGQVIPHVECRIVDPLHGHTVEVGQAGELHTRGYSVMLGYWQDEEKTRAVIDADGWMHTGDLAAMDEEGYVRIVGRIKDVIIRGGENVYPSEIENFYIRHPLIEDVQIVGVPDERYGEELCAVVIRSKKGSSTEEITPRVMKEFGQGQIAHYKIPKYVVVVEQFPLTITGKVQKHILRDIAIEALRLRDDGFKMMSAT